MKITEILANSKECQFTFEILPPLKGQKAQDIFDHIDPLMEFKPPFIDVTYHREETVYKRLPSGLLQEKVVRKRPGTVGICAAIMHRYETEAVPHVLCGGFTREDTENVLIDLNFLGIENIVALRGDQARGESYFTPKPEGNAFSIDLVRQINDLNQGRYLDEELQNSTATDFCIGVAGYPEKHFEAPSLNIDINHLKSKVDAGADYIVTQLFFDNQKYFEFVTKCRDAGITVPIIPGLKPLVTKRQLSLLPQIFHVDIPDSLAIEVLKCKDNDAVRKLGIAWCIEQSKELQRAGVPVLHYYSMGKSTNIQEIASAVF
ncbi:MAG: methylenetetrahydrofolate reductase [NAD(P)H] [Flavobacteriales bacterium]|jgi:methylenetetrahydrofolate reductase (NADPH)|tara:strand:+ start:5306 stop:6259 length:954 start_codon:yes stop_codon:yes gene_type:complete